MTMQSAPTPVGTASATASDADIGKLYTTNGKIYRYVQAGTNLAANVAVVTAVSAGVPTWVVTTTTTAGNSLVAGGVPLGQLDSTGASGVLAGDRFLIQVGGNGTLITQTASVAIGSALGTHTVAGRVEALSATFAATTVGATFAVLTATSVAAGSSTVRFVNLA